MDDFLPVPKISLWRAELAYLTWPKSYKEFSDRNDYRVEMEKFFGVVFYNPPIIGKAVYTLLDYTHNINR